MNKLSRVLVVPLLCAIFFAGARVAGAYEEVAVSGGGTIKGKVTFQGEVPMRKVVPTKDMEVCGSVREDPLITMGTGNGVVDAVVYLKDVKKGKKWVKPAKTPVLDNKNCRFVPLVQVIPVGMNVAIHNSDPVLHNTHGFLIKSTMFNVAMPKQGMQIEKPLTRPGIIRIECDSHGWMRGWIYVADNPYYAMTGKDGTFHHQRCPARELYPGHLAGAYGHQGNAGHGQGEGDGEYAV